MDNVRAEVTARRLVKDETLPISLEILCERYDIELYFMDMLRCDAIYMEHRNCRYIAVNDNNILVRQRFSIAHEFGHCVCGHGPIAFSGTTIRPHWQEAQANRFAAELLMPKPHLIRFGMLTPQNIKDLCGVSLQAATIRAEQLGWGQMEISF